MLNSTKPLPYWMLMAVGNWILWNSSTVKPVQNGHSQKRPKWFSRTNYRLMQVKSIAECSKYLLVRSLFCLFFRGRFTQVLQYV